ncbi:hypothetical protein BDR26DRAFT_870475 [Obelidium mucronatum]|nr:hypothetical protein BDR26DRAFT_870475 [Obelidium mucronatum]
MTSQPLSVSAIVSFGESHIDTGNLYTLSNFTWPPQTWPKKHFCGGRFTNGPVFVERLATLLNVPLHNFAFSAATSHSSIRGYTGPEGTTAVPSLNEQISHHFHRALKNKQSLSSPYGLEQGISHLSVNTDYGSNSNLKAGSLLSPSLSPTSAAYASHVTLAESSTSKSSLNINNNPKEGGIDSVPPGAHIGIPPESISLDIEQTLFVLTCGGNDHYFNHASLNCQVEIETIVQHIVDLVKSLQDCYSARQIVVFNIQDTSKQPNGGKPIKEGVAREHNQILKAKFEKEFGADGTIGSKGFVHLFDVCGFIDDIMERPESYGVKNVTESFVSYSGQLAPEDANPNDYLWWDGWHFTTPIHQFIADRIAKEVSEKQSIISRPALKPSSWLQSPSTLVSLQRSVSRDTVPSQ